MTKAEYKMKWNFWLYLMKCHWVGHTWKFHTTPNHNKNGQVYSYRVVWESCNVCGRSLSD